MTGKFVVNGKPQPNAKIVLHFNTLPWSYSRGGPRLTTDHQIMTDDEGNFAFDHLPALSGLIHAISPKGILGRGTEFQCRAGQNTDIVLGTGATITGKVALPEDVDLDSVRVRIGHQSIPIPYSEDLVNAQWNEKKQWLRRWNATEEGQRISDRNFILANSNIPGSISADGTVVFHGVPNGNLVLKVSQSGKGFLVEHEFECESGVGNIDLGILSHGDHDHDHAFVNEKKKLPKMIVKTVDAEGKPIKNVGVMFYDREGYLHGQEGDFKSIYKKTGKNGIARMGVMPQVYGYLQITPSQKDLPRCYTVLSGTPGQIGQATPPRANVDLKETDDTLTVTITLEPSVDLTFDIIDNKTEKIVFWSELYYQDSETGKWWMFGLVDGSHIQHNFLPFFKSNIGEKIRIAASGYEPKTLTLPDDLDFSKPVVRHLRLKPYPRVELTIHSPSAIPAQNARIDFEYPDGLDSISAADRRTNKNGVKQFQFPDSSDVGVIKVRHPTGTKSISMQSLLEQAQQKPDEIIRRTIRLEK